MANKKRLVETLAYICTHPNHWDQSTWRCRTGMCFAGHAALSVKSAKPVVPVQLMNNNYVQQWGLGEYVLAPRGSSALKLSAITSLCLPGDDIDEIEPPEAIKALLNRKVQSVSAEATDYLQLTGLQAGQMFGAGNSIEDLVGFIAEFTGSTEDDIVEATKAAAKRNGWRWPRKQLAESFGIRW